MSRLAATAVLLGLLACGREAQQNPPAPPPGAKLSVAAPWTWHPLGGLAVVEGEVAEPTELVLEGRSIRETRFAEPGPVRWEFFRPPEGETAVLRTAAGQVLARFEFSLSHASTAPAPKPKPASKPKAAPAPKATPEPAPAPAPIPKAMPKAARPAPTRPEPLPPQPEPPRTKTGTHPRNTPLTPLTQRQAAVLPPAPTAAPEFTPGPGRPPVSVMALHPEILPSPIAAPPTGAWPGMGEALNLTRGPGGHKRLLLSFDGGSTSEVAAEVLDTLKARGVRTTIFLTGAFIQRYPALVKRMAAEGHELGNHTMNHPHFAPGMRRDPKWTRERVQHELLEADAALVRLLGRPMDPFWRAPYGEHTAEIRRWAEEVGYRHVGWSEGADTLDWATPKERRLYRSGGAILQRLQQRLDRDGDGLIVLMHLGSERAEGDRPSGGLGAFMDHARSQGWAFVTVSAYLRDLGKPAWNPQQRLALLQTPGSTPQAR
ncbi:MAG TPA: polysaccharide deacetylase family protein [Geothrix sp.]|jgi:peptidoglycan/xylan/chitin deacetylase (PgdA/CDA1 family)